MAPQSLGWAAGERLDGFGSGVMNSPIPVRKESFPSCSETVGSGGGSEDGDQREPPAVAPAALESAGLDEDLGFLDLRHPAAGLLIA